MKKNKGEETSEHLKMYFAIQEYERTIPNIFEIWSNSEEYSKFLHNHGGLGGYLRSKYAFYSHYSKYQFTNNLTENF